MKKNSKRTAEGLFTNNGIDCIEHEYDELAFRWASLLVFGSFWIGRKEVTPPSRPSRIKHEGRSFIKNKK